jgi:Transcription elongation factor, GreA/GreB, C-term
MLSLKRALVRQLRVLLADEIALINGAAHAAARHEATRPAGEQSTDAAALDGAEADRARHLEHISSELGHLPLRLFGEGEPIAGAALIEIALGSGKLHCFMAPQGGGMKVELYGREIQVITPQSPLGSALLGKKAGDIVEIRTEKGARAFEILAVV